MTTPRQPAKRAKGRAQKMFRSAESDDSLFVAADRPYPNAHPEPITLPLFVLFPDEYEQSVERMARAMFAENFGIYSWSHEKAIWRVERENFTAQARAALKSIGIAAPRKERKQP